MEHEDNTQLDNNYAQNLMENLRNSAGDGVGGICGIAGDGSRIVGEEIVPGNIVGGVNVVGKFEDDDDEEWKYIKEVQQSEKQQTVKGAGDGEEFVVSAGNGNGNAGVDEMLLLTAQHQQQQQQQQNAHGNGVEFSNGDGAYSGKAAVDFNGDEEEADAAELEVIKNDGDFSTTSNTTSTAGEDDVLQVEMKMEELQHEQQQEQQPQSEQQQEKRQHQQEIELDEEEPSSLATNTTNGTSSLSENLPQQQQQQQLQEQTQQHEQKELIENDFDKENSNPTESLSRQRPAELDFQLHSQLNPDAREFVPSFGSNTTSPTSPPASGDLLMPHLGNTAAVPHHLLAADDDFLAQSPCKGRGVFNMDSISIPGENEFEHEAAKRPHELEQEDDMIGDGALQQQQHELPLEKTEENHNNQHADIVATNNLLNFNAEADEMDFQPQTQASPVSLIDHGPETCVDLDVDIDMQSVNDVMKRSIYVENEIGANTSIEDLLNSVQPLPVDNENGNEAFDAEQKINKELLNVEEKENISLSPSLEEAANDFYAANSAVAAAQQLQMPIDMDNAAHMQESFYMEHTSNEHAHAAEKTPDSLLADTTNPFDENSSFQVMRSASPQSSHDIAAKAELLASEQEFWQGSGDIIPSPLSSTEEKHLMEDTKEQQQIFNSAAAMANEFFNDDVNLEQKMHDLLLNTDGTLLQEEEVAKAATANIESVNPFFGQAAEQQNEAEQMQNEQSNNNDDDNDDKRNENIISDELQQMQHEQQQQHEEQENEQLLVADVKKQLFAFDEEQQQQQQQQEPLEEAAEIKLNDVELVVEAAAAAAAEVATTNETAFDDSAAANIALPKEPEEVVANIETKQDAAAITAAAATAAAVGIGIAAAAADKIKLPVKEARKVSPAAAKTAAAAAKPKVSDAAKKSTTATTLTKKPAATTTTAAARPRTAPAAAKTTNAAAAATTARKPATATAAATTAAKTATKTTARAATATTNRTAVGAAAAKPAATARATSATAARRTVAATTTTTAAAAAAKPRTTTTAALHKPTTLGISATAAKPKASSPRAALGTTQMRKTVAVAAAKSPVKPLSAANGHAAARTATTNNTTAATRTAKSTATATSNNTTTTTTATKTFTARPAPKTTHLTATATATKRPASGGLTAASNAVAAARANASAMRKSSPLKPTTTTTTNRSSPAAAARSANKTKAAAPAAAAAERPAPIKKPVSLIEKTNEAVVDVAAEQTPKLNGDAVVNDFAQHPLENAQEAVEPLLTNI